MTCIVGLVHGGKVHMAADSAATDNGLGQSVRLTRKMFVANDDILIGCAGSPRVRDLIRYKLPTLRFDPMRDDVTAFIVVDFIDSLRQTLKDGGACVVENAQEGFDGELLIGYRGKLFTVYSDFQVEERIDEYSAVGSGADIAQGSLFSTQGLKLSPKKRLERALTASERYNAGVRAPFHFMSL